MENNNKDASNHDDKTTKIIIDIPDGFHKVLSIKTEDSMLETLSKQINFVISSNIKSLKKTQDNEILNERVDEAKSEKDYKAELQKRVEIGEITPFEAVSKESVLEQDKGIIDKSCQILDLQKYFKQQAAFAEQKRKLKKISKISCNKDHAVKKLKVSDTVETKTSKRSHKSKLDESNTGSVTLESVKKPVTSHVVNEALRDNSSGSEYVPSDSDVDFDMEDKTLSKKKKVSTKLSHTRVKRIRDDGNNQIFKQRMETNSHLGDEAMHNIDEVFKLPKCIWERLYRYQQVSVQWLWELHGRKLGGLLGDEMGLGKTVQVIAFLAGIDCSELLSHNGRFRGLGPTIIVCPATLMEQWLKHFHEWWPLFRVVVFHHSGEYNGDPQSLIESLQTGGILITSYNSVLRHKDLLVSSSWHYIILDEGHKIRNPEAKITQIVKKFSTPHRLLLTGSPMQNSLKELWSLFDFILPGKLGILSAFLEHCAGPITRGGYVNATSLQKTTALHVAIMLKDTITPYMLRRTKANVKHHLTLPEKNEQILFCSLTDEQKKLYKKYLSSEDVSFVLHEKNNHENGRYRARFLIALSTLRKICNHPDLFVYSTQFEDSNEDIDLSEEQLEKFGYWKRAGKMIVVRALLKIWQKQGHRVLLFSQGKQMMHILESLLQQEKYSYLRMDGTTVMSQRQQIIYRFNNNPSYFVFLLTTRVGGLGVNLTGANRVIIYDPDWNPATDIQARERVWRIGQDKQVTIYRLITAGTIEEKIYHRQIFKLLLSTKVLDDPRQRRLFKTSDLVELFNLNEPIDGETSESDRLFKESKLTPTLFSPNKIKEMRRLAVVLSKNISAANITAKLKQDEDKNEEAQNDNRSDIEEQKPVVQDNSKCFEIPVMENDSSMKQILFSEQNITQDSLKECNKKLDTTLKVDITTNSYTRNNDISKDSFEQDLIRTKSTNNNYVEKETKAISGDDTIQSGSVSKSSKRKKQTTRKIKENASAMFEGTRVPCLIGRRLGKSTEKEGLLATTDDDYVLRKLFAKSSVSSAFQHEAILSNARDNENDENTMQRFARQSAQESMDFVRQSGKFCWRPA